MALTLIDPNKKRTLTLTETPASNAGLAGVPVWTVLPTGGLTLFPSTDGLSCDIVWASALALQTVSVTATTKVSNAILTATVQVQTLSALTITTPATLPDATQNSPYSQQLSATGGTAPYTWTVSTGTIATGLTLSPAGVLSGTPSASGISTFTVQAADTGGNKAILAVSLTIGTGTPVITALTITVGPEV